jgi:glycine/D-amino acid oxidase-like deaminating enzyme/nitrite reductase/ring-hydroxylating ferredoxin subunit
VADKTIIMIPRDGATNSLWQANTIPYKPINSVDGSTKFDVIIAGGGITGFSTALILQQAGKQCLLVDAANICFGTTGGTTAHLNTLLDTPYTTIIKNFSQEDAKLVANAVGSAIQLVQSNINGYEIDCGFRQADAYLFAQEDAQVKELDDILKALGDVDIAAQYSQRIPIPAHFKKAIRVSGQAKFNPTQYVYGLAKAFEEAGGLIMQHCRVTGAEENDKNITVETTQGTYTTKQLVYATHIPMGINLLHLRCAPYRSYAMAVTLSDENYPDDLCYDMYDPYHYYRTQVINGRPYLIAGGYDHKTAHETNTNECFRQLESHVRSLYKVSAVAHQWSSQYFEPADGIPYIGHLPGHPGNIYVATGFGGNGMVYSGVAAQTLSAMILGKETPYEKLFDPNRIKPVAGFANFISHNADVIKQFAGKWFYHEELEELAALAPGEGKVVVFNKHKIAIYKSEHGKLYAVNPICTHMKCEVKWNGAEKSWDCPCHGARYSYDGSVLTGPSDQALEMVNIRTLVEK